MFKMRLRHLISFAVSCFLLPFCGLYAAELDLLQEARAEGIHVYWDPLSQNCVLEKGGHQISFLSGGSYIIKDYSSIEQQKAPEMKNGSLVATSSFFNEAKQYFTGQGAAANSGTAAADSSSEATPVALKMDPASSTAPASASADTRPHAVKSGVSGIVVPDLSSPGSASAGSYSIGAILIDPGHGGKDPGASSTFMINGKKTTVVEKDINLNVGLKLYAMLSKAYPKKKILMTRSTDKYLTLEERTDIANSVKLGENEAVLYLSVHVNASLDKDATGFEVWYLSPGYRRQVIDSKDEEDKSLLSILNSMMEEEYTTESILMAKFIEDGINAQVGAQSPRRGIKEEEWFVVRNAKMPSVLVETGFLSNEQEAALLSDDGYLKKLSLGIYNGLGAFITHFERSRGFTGN